MKTVLIPTDFSENSWNAVEYAVRFFEKTTCYFYLLHIGNLRESSIASNSFSMFPQQLKSPLREQFDNLFRRIKLLAPARRHQFFSLQEYGSFTAILRKTVEEKRIDLIVMGTRGATGLKKAVVGSNTGDVITKVHCNVLVIPEKSKMVHPREIAFPTDHNIFYSHSILETMTEVLRISNANLQVLNITKPNVYLTADQEKNKGYLRDYLEETFLDSHSFHTVDNMKVRMAIERFVKDRNIDAIIMVAKNLNFLQQTLFDSTIEKLSFHTTVPIWVLHE